MRTMVARQRRVVAAAIAVPLALLTACGVKSAPSGDPSPTEPETGVPLSLTQGTVLISNGTNTVMVGGQAVRFSTTVTDAVWAPDGSRIAFVDGDGNICTARPDGTGRFVLTKHIDGVVRSHPTWLESQIVYSQSKKDGTTKIMSVYSSGGMAPTEGSQFYYGFDAEEEATTNAEPSGVFVKGSDRELAFQHKGANGPEVWVADLNQRSPWSQKVADGTDAALSPDGSKVAYVGTNGQIAVVVTSTQVPGIPPLPKPVQISKGATSPRHLAWSADGKQIAFSTPTDIESVGVGAGPVTPKKIAPAPGVPTYLGPSRDTVMRVKGSDPVATSIVASHSRWPTQKLAIPSEDSRANRAIIVGTGNLPVAFGAAELPVWGPVLFTGGASLDPRTAAELTRVLGAIDPTTGYAPDVYLAGGTDVISAKTEAAVKALGYHTVRLAGSNQLEAAMSVVALDEANYVQSVYVVDSHDIASVAAVSSGGIGENKAVLLTDGTTLAAPARTYINSLGADATLYPVGSAAKTALNGIWPGKPSTLHVTPLGDTDAGASSVLGRQGDGLSRVVVVDRSSLSDLIVAIGMAHLSSGIVLAIDPKAGPDPAVKTWLAHASAALNEVVIVDSSSSIGPAVERAIGELVSGPFGYTSRTP
jgi:dipeptidyl aminopeptidase/acylaminoacyl peptidase